MQLENVLTKEDLPPHRHLLVCILYAQSSGLNAPNDQHTNSRTTHTHTYRTQLWIVKNIEMFLFFFSFLLFLLSAWIRPDCYTYRVLSVLYLWQIDAFSSCVETFFLGGFCLFLVFFLSASHFHLVFPLLFSCFFSPATRASEMLKNANTSFY